MVLFWTIDHKQKDVDIINNWFISIVNSYLFEVAVQQY